MAITRRLVRPVYSAFLVAGLSSMSACSGTSDDSAPPANDDAAIDSTASDSAIDTAMDTAIDTAIDSGTDVTVDSAMDATDAVADASDTAAETATDAGSDTAMCATGGDCPGVDSECSTRACISGSCTFSYAADGTAVGAQTAGDCKKVVCDGAGGTKTVNDDADVPVDARACTNDVCTSGVPSNPLRASGFVCSESGGKVCNSAGTCVGCLTTADCTSPSTCDTTTNTCVTSTCSDGIRNGSESDVDCGGSCPDCAVGKICSAAGDCASGVCTGGVCVAATCFDLVRNGSETDVDCGGSCARDCAVGKLCVGNTDCESAVCLAGACRAPFVTTVTPMNSADGVSTTQRITVTFNGPIARSTLTTQPTAGPCTGNVRVSPDDFATCIGLASLSLGAGDTTVATFTPQGSFSLGTNYKLRVTTGVANSFGTAIAAPWNSDFDTAGAVQCSTPQDTVVISQVYGASGVVGAAFNRDYIELHNRGTTAVNLTGWSVQAGPSNSATMTVGINLTGTIPAGGYYLVGGTLGTAGADPLADQTGTMDIPDAAGKVALVASTALLSGTCSAIDMVGYGSGAGCFEGLGRAPSMTAANAIFRQDDGCSDGDQNALDFIAAPAAPRRSATATQVCATCVTRNQTVFPEHADYCAIQPDGTAFDITATAGAPTRAIYTQVYESGKTESAGAATGVVAEIGYGPATVNPSTQSGWTWKAASYNTQVGNNDEYSTTLTVSAAGTYRYTTRFSLDGGATWTYCDKNGAGATTSSPFEVAQLPTLTVSP